MKPVPGDGKGRHACCRYYGFLINVLVTSVTAAAVFAVWVANRKRIAAETVGRAEEQALAVIKDAERDAETRKKETLLEAKEKAHDLLTQAERQARQERQQAQTLEQTADRREATLAERQPPSNGSRRTSHGREHAVADREKARRGRRRRNTSGWSPSSSTSSSASPA